MSDLNIRLTEHARRAMRERDVTFDDIVDIIAYPEVVGPAGGDAAHRSPDHLGRDRTNRRKFQKGNITLIVADNEFNGVHFHVVITVLWRTRGRWTNDQFRGRS